MASDLCPWSTKSDLSDDPGMLSRLALGVLALLLAAGAVSGRPERAAVVTDDVELLRALEQQHVVDIELVVPRVKLGPTWARIKPLVLRRNVSIYSSISVGRGPWLIHTAAVKQKIMHVVRMRGPSHAHDHAWAALWPTRPWAPSA